MNLLIVESPHKAQVIQAFLGATWKVKATIGHLQDLPEKSLGFSKDLAPEYVLTERGAEVARDLAALVKQAGPQNVYVATDPDREGEVIAWEVAEVLKLSKVKRCTFNEVTEAAVKAAIAAPRDLDMALVHAGQARRVLDRMCGYLTSGPLRRVTGEKVTAGRVQIPALMLLVERQRERKAFQSLTHYSVKLTFDSMPLVSGGWQASLDVSSIQGGQQ